MSGYLDFPRSREALAEAVDEAVAMAKEEQNVASVEWWVNHAYLQGARKINIVNWATGTVEIAYENSQGELEFKYEAVTYQYRVEMGRLMQMNVDPAVGQEGFGLDSVRKSGIGQATLSYMTSRMGSSGQRVIQGRLAEALLIYGTAGLSHSRIAGEDVGDRTHVEVVPPWELLPVPAGIECLDSLRGIMRERTVPLEWARSLGLKLGKDIDELEIQEYPYGVLPPNEGAQSYGGTDGAAAEMRASRVSKSRSAQKRSRKGRKQQWVRMVELYLYGARDYVRRYVVKIGRRIGRDEEYEGRIVCPLAVGRYLSTGRFYGRSFVGPQIGINYEVEKMLGNQFQVVADWDQFPMTVIPSTAGISKRELSKRERRKVLFAEPDPVNPNYQPYRIEPATPGDFPGKIASLAISLQDRWAGQSALYGGDAPGRVDNAKALGLLYETGNINLVAPVHEIAEVFVQVYGSMIQAARRESIQEGGEAWGGSFSIPILDERMIGVVVDPETGRVSLDQNPIPEPWQIKIDVEERMPTSHQQRKQEAGMMLQAGIISATEFRILNIRRGLEFPVLNQSDWEAWRKAIIMKVLLFNDGKTPGKAFGGKEFDRPEIMLAVLGEFMCGIEFAVASREVQNAFIVLKNIYLEMLGRFPDQLPSPEGVEGQAQGQEQGQASPRLAATA